MTQPPRPITIADVAQHAQVSAMTVSNVINNKPHVRPQTRQRVLDAIARTGYRVNPMARALAGGRGRMLSVITRQLNLPYVSEILMGAAESADALNYDLAVLMRGTRTSNDLSVMSRLSAGALLIQPDSRDEVGAQLPEHVISVDGPSARPLSVDNYGGARQAMAHLLGLGHTRVAIITGALAFRVDPFTGAHSADSDRDDAAERLRGYHDALRDARVKVPRTYVQDGDYRKPSAELTTRQLLSLPRPPTAIFASSDAMAIGAIHVAQDLGLSVPRDLSVVGFDDFPIASQTRPALTTVRQPLHQMGALAIRMLVELAEGRAVPMPPPFQTELMIRESTAPPPDREKAP
ncbi:LacI family DNA-binding transcriptional regulator [Deinococcus sp.]|uniref:LacI family DNA-binding transcriptional regulator n=1 Tax=Deinococcus sp. TaxID=47478 RepID=UPI0028699464|nr:LacI family DNA-binding transcriptional regulator [Deinococcus sp.]